MIAAVFINQTEVIIIQKANVNVNETSKPVITTDIVKIVGCSESHVWYVLAGRRNRIDAEKFREAARKMNYDWRKTFLHSSWDIADLERLQTPAVPVTLAVRSSL